MTEVVFYPLLSSSAKLALALNVFFVCFDFVLLKFGPVTSAPMDNAAASSPKESEEAPTSSSLHLIVEETHQKRQKPNV